MDPTQGRDEFVTYLSSERTRLREGEVVGIGRLSSAYEAGLLGDKSEMLLIAVASRLGNRKGALVDMSGLELGRRPRAPLLAAFVTPYRDLSCFCQ
jgi:hypothetical protein